MVVGVDRRELAEALGEAHLLPPRRAPGRAAGSPDARATHRGCARSFVIRDRREASTPRISAPSARGERNDLDLCLRETHYAKFISIPLQMRFLRKSPVQTFLLVPLAVLLFELALGPIHVQPAGALLMLWGYAQYRLVGRYRVRLGGGGPGLSGAPPEQIGRGRDLCLDAKPDVSRAHHLHDRLRRALRIVVRRGDRHRARCLVPSARAARRARARRAIGEPYASYTRRVKRWIPFAL